ncbi:hypothetical protein IMG5_145100 [Ichthyophthirius multifiliis]|uniref:Uncharacterized protein n=1 Tax=Ichthyophthirius multifiliis TaxID=5932 RepID=G0QXT0_ICHMU|nr:hypothetical protein IMG5_145100 [Ichthyophthirius multifiliis]EGR29961.1 hypothetical protein IMG5_145100 [Ichthyophthirius multifiliis]|eukprot:XP_004031197.1 hypothetical protein IMG5_145100 [Ichthyophthirius multifiliis]
MKKEVKRKLKKKFLEDGVELPPISQIQEEEEEEEEQEDQEEEKDQINESPSQKKLHKNSISLNQKLTQISVQQLQLIEIEQIRERSKAIIQIQITTSDEEEEEDEEQEEIKKKLEEEKIAINTKLKHLNFKRQQIKSESSEQENEFKFFNYNDQETEVQDLSDGSEQQKKENLSQEVLSNESIDKDIETQDIFLDSIQVKEDEQKNNQQSLQQIFQNENNNNNESNINFTETAPLAKRISQSQQNKVPETSNQNIGLNEDDNNNNNNNNNNNIVKEKNIKKKKKFNWSNYIRLLWYLKKQYKLVLIGYFYVILQSITQIYIPSFSGKLLDATTHEFSMKNLNDIALYAILLYLLNSTSAFFRTCIFNVIGEKIVNELKNECFEKFILNDISFHDKQLSGELVSRLQIDIMSSKSAVSSNMSNGIRNIFICIGNSIMLFKISKSLFCIIILLIPIFLIISGVYGRYLRKITKHYQDQSAKVNANISECLQNIKTVKAFSSELKMIDKFKNILQDQYNLGFKKSKSNGLYSGAISFVTNIATLSVLWLGGYLVLTKNKLTSGELASVILYTNSLADSSASISSSFTKIVTASASMSRLFKMIDKQPKVKIQGGLQVDFQGKIQFKNVDFYYKFRKNQPVLNELCLEILPGERVAFVGQSGCGKSTIIKLLERFYDVKKGEILIDNINIKDIDIVYLRQKIGYVSQEPLLFQGSIEENITYGLRGAYTQQQLDQACKLGHCYDFIHNEKLFPQGFKTIVGESGSKLSGGQKQRIAISRALILQPRILIFDEATSALDAESEFQVQQAIEQLMKQKNDMTIIMIAHRLSTIVNCNKIVVLNKGKVAEIGTHKALLQKKGQYKQLFERQLSGLTIN